MKVLFESIWNHFAPPGTKPDIYTDLSGRLYLQEAPQNTSYPYAVYQLVSHTHEWFFAEDLEEFTIQFGDVRFTNCTNNIYTFNEIIEFLSKRNKILFNTNGIEVNEVNICKDD